jgi:hypothetical protein
VSDAIAISAQRWRENWRAVTADGAVHVSVPRLRRQRRSPLAAVRELPAGARVVLSASAPGAAARCKAFASAAGVAVDREYLAFPTAATPAYLVQDAPAPARLFVTNVLLAPPGLRFSLPVDAALGLVRRLKSWRLIRVLAPGRVVVGRRA